MELEAFNEAEVGQHVPVLPRHLQHVVELDVPVDVA